MTTQFPLSGPVSVGGLLVRALRLYRARFGVFLLTSALFLVPAAVIFPFVITGNISVDAVYPVCIALHSFFLPGVIAIAVQDKGPAEYFTILLLMLTNGSVTLVLTVQSIEALHGRSLSAGGSIRRALPRFLPYAGMATLKWGIVFVGMFLAAVLGIFLLQFFFFVLPLVLSVFLLAYWLAAPAVLVAEGRGPVNAIERCWSLSRGNSLRVISYAFLLSALVLLLNFSIVMLAEEIVSALLPVSHQGLTIVTYGVGSILASFTAPFYASATVLLYYDLRVRRESSDLELRAAELGEEMAQDHGEEIA